MMTTLALHVSVASLPLLTISPHPVMFPVPLDYFPPLRLTKHEAKSFLQWGDALLQQTIDAYHRERFDTQEVREQKWKPIKQRHNLTVYRRRKIKDDSEYRYLCTGRIEGTLDEVVMGRYADNTLDFRRISGVYREDIVDCAVLGVIKKRSPDNPFFLSCFKWMTVESPGKGLVKNRDVCWYEQIGMTRDRNGKEIGYTLTESVNLSICPEFQKCVRAKFSICYLYKRNSSGGVNVYMRGKNDAGGKVVDWVADIKSADLWLRIEKAVVVAHAVIATALIEAGKHTMRPRVTPKTCALCRTKASSLFGSSKECGVCHRIMCSSCVSKVRVLSSNDFRVPEYEHFCTKCMRLIHLVDLRSPDSVRNLVEYVAGESEKMGMYERNMTRKRATTDESDEPEGHNLTSRSSTSGSICAFPQPVISTKLDKQEEDEDGTRHDRSREPAVPVILYIDPIPKQTQRSVDSKADGPTAESRRHSLCSRTSSDEIDYTGRESTSQKAMTADHVPTASSRPYGGNYNERKESLMTQIIQMNLIAEQSRQQIQDNMKMARQLRISRT